MFKSIKTKLGLALGAVTVFSASANAALPTVDLTDATTSIEGAGGAMIGLAVVLLGLGIMYSFVRRRA